MLPGERKLLQWDFREVKTEFLVRGDDAITDQIGSLRNLFLTFRDYCAVTKIARSGFSMATPTDEAD
jgi:hypothetical protein